MVLLVPLDHLHYFEGRLDRLVHYYLSILLVQLDHLHYFEGRLALSDQYHLLIQLDQYYLYFRLAQLAR